MASAATIDIEALLAPIPGGNPSGVSLRYAGTYDAIEQARREDDNLPAGDWKRQVKKVANWRQVAELSRAALSTKSKDLQIAAWLAEALARQHGFAGVRDGFRLLRELQERFWDTLYPLPEDGDLEVRAGALVGLNSKLWAAIVEIPITQEADGVEAYSLSRYLEARETDSKNAKAKQEAIAEGKITGVQFDQAVASSLRIFYEPLSEDLNQSFLEFEKLVAVVDGKFGPTGPALMKIKDLLEDCRSLVESIVKKKRETEPDPVSVAQGNGTVGAAPQAAAAAQAPARAPTGDVLEPQDRADALRRLEAIAKFFLRTEPQSPVALLVQRAVRWGQMPLEEWLTDVIRDAGVLAHIRETLGIKNQTQKTG